MMQGGKRGRIRRLTIESPQAVKKWSRGMTTVTQTACKEGEAWATDHREALEGLLQITDRKALEGLLQITDGEDGLVLKVLIL